MDLAALQNQIGDQQGKQAPVEKWDPAFCGDMDMQITHEGNWVYMGSPIGRKALVNLFASVIKREQDNYFLVTPVEKVGIQVADVPFVITQWQQQEQHLVFTTQTDERLVVSQQNPIKLQADRVTGAVLPYVKVKRNLWARLHQNVFYQLVELGAEQTLNGEQHLLLQSGAYTFSLGKL